MQLLIYYNHVTNKQVDHEPCNALHVHTLQSGLPEELQL